MKPIDVAALRQTLMAQTARVTLQPGEDKAAAIERGLREQPDKRQVLVVDEKGKWLCVGGNGGGR